MELLCCEGSGQVNFEYVVGKGMPEGQRPYAIKLIAVLSMSFYQVDETL